MWHLPCLPYISVLIYLRHVQGANLCKSIFSSRQVFFKKFLRGLLSLHCLLKVFSIVLKVVFPLSDRYKIVTSNWLWIEICENVVLSKIDVTMTIINKKL